MSLHTSRVLFCTMGFLLEGQALHREPVSVSRLVQWSPVDNLICFSHVLELWPSVSTSAMCVTLCTAIQDTLEQGHCHVVFTCLLPVLKCNRCSWRFCWGVGVGGTEGYPCVFDKSQSLHFTTDCPVGTVALFSVPVFLS